MIIPAEHRVNDGRNEFDRMERPPSSRPAHGSMLEEDEYVLMKDSGGSTDWYCAQTIKVLIDRFVVAYHTTTTPLLAHCGTAMREDRQKNIMEAKYSRT